MSSLLDKYLAVTSDDEVNEGKRRIKVVVKDWEGRLANQAIVRLYVEKADKQLHFLAKGYTNREGEVILNGLSKDKKYTLKISYMGIQLDKVIEVQKASIDDDYENSDYDNQIEDDYEDYGYDDQGDDEE